MFGFGKREVQQKKGLGKIGGLFGFAMFAGAAAGMYYNERNTAQHYEAIVEISKNAHEVPIATPNASNEGKAVYLNGQLETDAGVVDDYFGFGGSDVLVVKRDVEMYQWVEHRRKKRTEWRQEWSDDEESGSSEHRNPNFPVRGGTFGATDAHIGGFQVAQEQVEELDALATFSLPSELSSDLSDKGWRADGGGLYSGDGSAGSPQIGDVRVSFMMEKETEVSAMGRQVGNELAAYVAKNKYSVFFIEQGKQSTAQLTEHAQSNNSTLAYVIRMATGGFMVLGMGMAFSGMVSWLTWIPVLGPMIERFAFWIGALIGGVLAALVFLTSWLLAHPLALVGCIALASVAAIAFGMRKRQAGLAAASFAPPSMSMPPPPPPGGFGGPPPPPR
jgi:hypothetical protein